MPESKRPDPGEGLTEAEIVSWKVKVGDTVKINDIAGDRRPSRSSVPPPFAGTVSAILVPEGETVDIGTDHRDQTGRAAAPEAALPTCRQHAAVRAAEEDEPPMKTLVGYGPRTVESKRRPRKGGATPATDAGAATQMQVQGSFSPGGAQSQAVVEADEPAVPAHSARTSAGEAANVQVLAKPPVRKLAKDLGVDLRSVTPTA
jgi:pyruvate dehydrogenase E2 component (dihydrolipoamide acetyltransferase)